MCHYCLHQNVVKKTQETKRDENNVEEKKEKILKKHRKENKRKKFTKGDRKKKIEGNLGVILWEAQDCRGHVPR
jgi:hypothetical protein